MNALIDVRSGNRALGYMHWRTSDATSPATLCLFNMLISVWLPRSDVLSDLVSAPRSTLHVQTPAKQTNHQPGIYVQSCTDYTRLLNVHSLQGAYVCLVLLLLLYVIYFICIVLLHIVLCTFVTVSMCDCHVEIKTLLTYLLTYICAHKLYTAYRMFMSGVATYQFFNIP